MSGSEIAKTLEQIDKNIQLTMDELKPEILTYLQDNSDRLVQQLKTTGVGRVPTRMGELTISRKDLEKLV